MLLAIFLFDELLSLNFYATYNYLPSGDTAYNGLGHFTSIISQDKAPQTYLQANMMEASSPFQIPHFR